MYVVLYDYALRGNGWYILSMRGGHWLHSPVSRGEVECGAGWSLWFGAARRYDMI